MEQDQDDQEGSARHDGGGEAGRGGDRIGCGEGRGRTDGGGNGGARATEVVKGSILFKERWGRIDVCVRANCTGRRGVEWWAAGSGFSVLTCKFQVFQGAQSLDKWTGRGDGRRKGVAKDQ